MLNKVILIGNVGSEPELKKVNENSVVTFSLATSEKWKNKSGENQEKTEWHNCSAWGKRADVINEYVKKGSRLYVEGKISYRKYEKDGETKYFTDISVNDLKFLSQKNESSSDSSESNDLPY